MKLFGDNVDAIFAAAHINVVNASINIEYNYEASGFILATNSTDYTFQVIELKIQGFNGNKNQIINLPSNTDQNVLIIIKRNQDANINKQKRLLQENNNEILISYVSNNSNSQATANETSKSSTGSIIGGVIGGIIFLCFCCSCCKKKNQNKSKPNPVPQPKPAPQSHSEDKTISKNNSFNSSKENATFKDDLLNKQNNNNDNITLKISNEESKFF